jgi:hypothetical protein
MTQAWVTLTASNGQEIHAPSERDLAAALASLYKKPKRGAQPGEPGSAVLRFGYDDGLMYAAQVSSSGELSFEEWSDRDCELALATPRRMRGSQAEAKLLWDMMCKRQVAKIRELPWQSGA